MGLLLARLDTRLDNVTRLYCQDAWCTPVLLNVKDNAGRTPLMLAVYLGYLANVRELARVEGVDWETRNTREEARYWNEYPYHKNFQAIVRFLEERAAGHQVVRASGASRGCTESLHRDPDWRGWWQRQMDPVGPTH